jgi:predicted nucleic acid-binding protein
MLADIVIDTNVFLHAENDQEQRKQDCQDLINALIETTTKLCVDEGFDLEESRNRSHIGHEYIKHLRAGTLGYALIERLARSGRMLIVPRKVPTSISRHIRQIPNGPDRTYVQVAFNSREKLFASHDFGDIPQTVRDRIRGATAVKIVAADAARLALRAAEE